MLNTVIITAAIKIYAMVMININVARLTCSRFNRDKIQTVIVTVSGIFKEKRGI
jgi:hypothetical protein